MKTRITQERIRHDGHRGSPRWLPLLAAVCLLAVPGLSSAQFHSEVVRMPYTIPIARPSHYVVRNFDEQHTVSYAKSIYGHELMITKHDSYTAGSTLPFINARIAIPGEVMEIRDIRVLDDYVYFCGRDTNYRAVIGYFRFTSSPLSLPSSIELVEVTGAQTLWRMAVYKNSLGAPKVVAVGIGSANPYSDRVVVEVDGIRNPATTSCKVALLSWATRWC